MVTTDRLNFEELKELGAGHTAPSGIASLYHQAFQKFGNQSIWSRQPSENPTIAQALVISDCLRHEGDQTARAFAVLIEDACRATFKTTK